MNTKDYEYSNQLYQAIVDQDEETFEKLLDQGGDLNKPRSAVNYVDDENIYPLECACQHSVSMAYRLIEEGADPTIVDDYLSSTPLIYCVSGTDPSRYELAMKLIELGADPEHIDKNNRTVLNLIGLVGKNDDETTMAEGEELLQYMFDHCDVEKIMKETKDSPLNRAVRCGNLEMVQYILDNNLVDIDHKGQGGRTPLMDSIRSGKVEICKYLLSKGASQEGTSNKGKSCMDFAKDSGDQEFIDLLEDR